MPSLSYFQSLVLDTVYFIMKSIKSIFISLDDKNPTEWDPIRGKRWTRSVLNIKGWQIIPSQSAQPVFRTIDNRTDLQGAFETEPWRDGYVESPLRTGTGPWRAGNLENYTGGSPFSSMSFTSWTGRTDRVVALPPAAFAAKNSLCQPLCLLSASLYRLLTAQSLGYSSLSSLTYRVCGGGP